MAKKKKKKKLSKKKNIPHKKKKKTLKNKKKSNKIRKKPIKKKKKNKKKKPQKKSVNKSKSCIKNNKELKNKKIDNKSEKIKKNKIDKNIFIRMFIIIILIVILIYCGYNIAIWMIDNSKTTKIQNEIISNVVVEEVTHDEEEENIVSYINVDIETLKETNEDTVGWLQVLGTDINYPIVQSTDNEYYLTHDYLKDTNKRGWIFLDYRNDLDNLSKNNIIFGHRNANGSMFGTLKNVLTDEWLENDEYHTIKVSSLNYNYIFEVISVYTIPVETYYMTTSFASNEEYQTFLDTIISRSIYDFNIQVSTDDYLITLSTCTGDGTKRLVVHAKLSSYIEKE